jgi:plasmid stability protein
MTDLTIRRLPDELHALLRQRAEANHRSVNRETIALIEHALKAEADVRPRLSAADVLAKARRFAKLPVLDARPVHEWVQYDADGLPKS